jgi:hypothetical protein
MLRPRNLIARRATVRTLRRSIIMLHYYAHIAYANYDSRQRSSCENQRERTTVYEWGPLTAAAETKYASL